MILTQRQASALGLEGHKYEVFTMDGYRWEIINVVGDQYEIAEVTDMVRIGTETDYGNPFACGGEY